MPIQIPNTAIPLWSGTNGNLSIDVQTLPLDAPPPVGDVPLLDATFNVNGGASTTLGDTGNLSLSVAAGASAKLAILFKDHTAAAQDVVDLYGLANSLTASNGLVVLDLGANAKLDAAGSFQYSFLKLGATLDTAANGQFIRVQPFDRTVNLDSVLESFIENLQIPSSITKAPGPFDLTVLNFDGYLQLGASVSAGYEIKGTKAFTIADLALSEAYDLSVLGTFAVTGKIAGQFSIEVRAGAKDGWANVKVNRARQSTIQASGGVELNATLNTQGLPTSPQEFLGAILGVQAKNWLNLISSAIDDAGQVTDLASLKAKLDSLSEDFVDKWLGKGIDQIISNAPEIPAALAKVNAVVTSYKNLDQSAIALFDRYFDPLASHVDKLVGALTTIKGLASWAGLPSEVESVLWNVLRQLTNGDPLGAILGGPLALTSIQGLADQALSMIQSDAHAEIRNVIQVAKTNFPLDGLLNQLDSLDSVPKLKSAADSVAAHFLERIIGKTIDSTVSDSQLKAFVKVVQAIQTKKTQLLGTLQNILQQASSQSLSATANIEYQREDDTSALIDCDLNLNTPAGANLMKAAGRGDFTQILSQFQPGVVIINQGRLTHNLTKTTTLSVNVTGWHLDFHYLAMDKLLTNLEQQIKTSTDGSLLVSTDTSINVQSVKGKNIATSHEDSVRTNFLLRYLGETRQKIGDSKFNAKTKTYLLDTITQRSAVYTLGLTEANTTQSDLNALFSFAAELGLDRVGATTAGLLPYLPKPSNPAHPDYGNIQANYEVRFTEQGLSNLLHTAVNLDNAVTAILQGIVIASYAAESVWLLDVAAAFCSPTARAWFNQNPVTSVSQLGFHDIPPSPVAGITLPKQVNLQQTILIEDLRHLFRALAACQNAVASLQGALTGPPMPAADFQNRLQKFGEALQEFHQTSLAQNAVFAVFDHLIQLTTPAPSARASALSVTFTRDAAPKTITFSLQAQPAALQAGAH